MTDPSRGSRAAVAAALVILLAGCQAGEAPPAADEALVHVPGTFRGDLPCADCPGIRHTLELLPDNRYVLRREYLERATTAEETGHWHVDGGRGVLVLESPDSESSLQWRIDSPTRLEQLDLAGQPIASGLNYTLTRDP